MLRNTERIHLTVERIRRLLPPTGGQAIYVFDDDPRHLCVRVTTAGAKSFVYAGKLNKTPFRITIGSTNVWNLDDARAEARRLQTLVDKGIDPRELERKRTEAEIQAKEASEAARIEEENRRLYTLRALCNAYGDLLEARGKTQSARQARSIFKCHVLEAHPAIAALPACEITPDHAAEMIRAVIEQGKDRTAGVLRSYLSAAFNCARKARFDAKLPSGLIAYRVEANPAEPISAIAVNRGNRTLCVEELKIYIGALSDHALPDQALKLALFAGGQRMAQLLRAKVSDYDSSTQTLRLWDGKGRRQTPREHLLPLAPIAAGIVERLVVRADILKTQLLFSSSGKTQLVETTPGKRVSEISRSMKGESFDLRDIRRTAETMLASIKVSKDLRAQLMSHGLSGVQNSHYDRYDYWDDKRVTLIAWEQQLGKIAKGKSREIHRARRTKT